MTPQDVEAVQSSWKTMVPIKEQAAGLYGKLFELNPTLRPLFKGDMTEQGRKLTAMLSTVIAWLTRLETVVPAAQALVQRRVGYGVKPEHYQTVGAALIWTLQQGLGPAFTLEVQGRGRALMGYWLR